MTNLDPVEIFNYLAGNVVYAIVLSVIAWIFYIIFKR